MKQLVVACFALFVVTSASADRWYTYEDCRLMPNESNDGDSFHVKTRSNHMIFRLYFVDAGETDRQVPERLTEQAAYWGITEAEVMQVGKQAAAFTAKFLAKGFTAYSKRHDARGASKLPRYFAMIEAGDEYLSEALVRNGLARVYGAPTELPDGTDSRKHWGRLRVAEREAKRMKRGAWGLQKSRLQQFLEKK